MDCQTIRDELALVALGEGGPLSPPMVDHLADCAKCREAYHRYTATVGLLADAVPRKDPPARLRHAVLSRIAGDAPEKKPARIPSRNRNGWMWGVAAAALMVLINVSLVWNTVQIHREMDRLVQQSTFLQAELAETWRAFSGAPAQYAGALVFDRPEGAIQVADVSAEGYLYQRPNGWAALIQVRGDERTSVSGYDVWFREEGSWRRAGPLLVDADGVGSFLVYAREPELAIESVRIVPDGVMPGTPRWRQETLLAGAVVRDGSGLGGRDYDGVW